MGKKAKVEPGLAFVRRSLSKQQQEALTEITQGYEKRIRHQATRLGFFVQFLEERGLLDEFNAWTQQRATEYVEERKAEDGMRNGPCAICGDPEDHNGVPHGTATGDHKTRAEAEWEAKGYASEGQALVHEYEKEHGA